MEQEKRFPDNHVSLREHIDAQIKWLDRYFASQIVTIQEKTREAKEQIDKRLEGMNEFRDTLRDQAGRLVTRVENNSLHDAIETRLKSMEISRASGEGKLLMVAAFIAFAASIAVAVIARWLVKL